jgi:hypothetical protein
MRQLARLAAATRHQPPPRGAVLVLGLLATVALLAVPAAGAAPAGERPCPAGLARVASWEPIQVTDGKATVAFVLAAGCKDVPMSLVSYLVRAADHGGRQSGPVVLHAATGVFSTGKVNRLTALVGSDCAFRVVFAVGRPDTAAQPAAAVESAFQAPDPCRFGAAPVVVTGSTSTTAAQAATATSVAPTTTTPPTRPQAAGTRREKAAEAPATTRPREQRGEARAGAAGPPVVASTAGAEARSPVSSSPATSIGLSSEPVSAVGVGPSGPLAGWDGASLLGLGVLAMAAGATLLWLARPRRQE